MIKVDWKVVKVVEGELSFMMDFGKFVFMKKTKMVFFDDKFWELREYMYGFCKL